MKKKMILSLLLGLLLISACSGGSIYAEDKTSTGSETILDKEEIICRSGKKIWVGWKKNGYGAGLTSEIVGDCE